jgi:hypothetical protein
MNRLAVPLRWYSSSRRAGGREQGSAINLVLRRPSKMRGLAERGEAGNMGYGYSGERTIT